MSFLFSTFLTRSKENEYHSDYLLESTLFFIKLLKYSFFVWYATNFLQILVGFRFHFSRKRLIILYIKTRYKNSNIMSCDDKITSEVSSLSLWVFYVFRQVIQGKQQRTNITIQLLSSCLLITIIFINLLL